MKLSTVVLLAFCLQVQAIGFSQKINISGQNLSLDKVFKEIRKQTGYLFFYDVDWLQKAQKINVNMKDAALKDVLDHCLANQPLTYSIVDKTIVLSLKEDPNKQAPVKTPVFADIGGQVRNAETKEPIEGVSVTIKGTNRGTRTNFNGAFILKNVTPGATLVFSFVGFETREVKVQNDDKAINIMLDIDSKNLDNVVVVGYGTVKRKDVTGSVSSVKMEDMNKAPVRSFEEALAGRMPGVQVSSNEGQPGSSINVIIRGNNSITQDNSPLYVIDGFPIENPDNNMLSPNDIESIDVLKDASATAIYGARGSNGVIIITTKKGKDGPPVIRYSGYYGLQKNLKTIPVMDPYQFVKLQQELGVSDLSQTYLANGVTVDDYKDVPGIDWQKKLYRDASMMDHSLSLMGGTSKTRYNISGDVFNQDGIIINSGYKRYQGKISLDQTINDQLKIGGYAMFTNNQRTGTIPSSMSNSSMNNLLFSAWGYRPVSPIKPSKVIDVNYEDDLFDDMVNPTTDYRLNPVIIAENEYRFHNINNLIGNAYVDYTIIKGLKLRITGGVNKTIDRYDFFNNSKTRSGNPSNINGVNGGIYFYQTDSWLNENTLTYDKKIGTDHHINVVAGLTEQNTKYQFNGTFANQLQNESLGLSGLGFGTPQPVYPDLSEASLVSVLGRVNYNYKERYLLTLSYRNDGSSKFRGKNTWARFPSGAIAWRLSGEPFMEQFSFLSEAKLRASWGATGNNRIPPNTPYARMGFDNSVAYSYNNTLQPGASLTSMASDDLRWETTYQTDAGIDIGFFKQRISLSVDYYKKITKDLLLNASLPPTTGYSSAYKNIGKTSNEGLEIALATTNIVTRDFTWSSSFNISFNKSNVLGLTQNQESLTSTMSWDSWYASVPLYMAKIGQPLGQMYGFITDGVYQYADFDQLANGTYLLKPDVTANDQTRSTIKPGDIKFRDLNGDKAINDYDRSVIGRGFPLHIGGFINNFRYKNFDLSVFFQWSYGNDIINANRLNFERGNKTYLNQFASFANRWTPDHTNTSMPRAGGQVGNVYSSLIVEDGSYLRLKTASFGYTLPASILQKAKLKSCRLYASAQNIFTWTKYTGSDPEVSIGYSALTPGFDYSSYPRARTLTVGLNVSF